MLWWTQAIIASIITSLISICGLGIIVVSKKKLAGVTVLLVAVAAGTLLGDAFFHLIPQSISNPNWPLLVIGGMMVFFVLEKILHWRHCHESDCQNGQKVASISLVADSIHNLIDGLAIAASFGVSREVGIATTAAIIFHEIPQEIGDLAILIHSGMKTSKALLLNLVSGSFSILGVILVMILGNNALFNSLGLVTAGGFIYLAASDLIPELHRHDTKIKGSIIQLVMVLMGVALMWWFRLLE